MQCFWIYLASLLGLVLVGGVILPTPTYAQLSDKQLTATRITERPRLDGHLDDSAWQAATFVSDFLQRQPNERATPTQRTEVAILFDNEALYIAAKLYHDNPSAIRATMTRHDRWGDADRFIVSLDTYRDRRTAYSFGVTAAGVRFDYYHAEDEQDEYDLSFDPVWDVRTHRDRDGWTAEMRIPFSQLRFTDQAEQVWGINLNRWMPDGNEDTYWVLIPQDETGWASRFGTLTGITRIRPSRRLEVLPYVASNATFREDVAPANPFGATSDMEQRIGGDVKMGLGSNLTLEATFNPDFGQVEADPAVVNLSAFEVFFNERRPFFTEGNQLLRGEGATFFYSRRIGASPHGFPDEDFVDRPNNTTILAATKLTGRLPSGLSIGMLGAVTEREFARTFSASPDRFGRTEVEPLAGWGVLRLQQELGPSASTIGVSLTGIQRDLDANNSLDERLTRQAYSGGMDWNMRFRDGQYVFTGDAGFSYVDGSETTILRLQRSSARFYQRPDADHTTLDSTRTSMSGYRASMQFAKQSGRHWLWSVSGFASSPGFEINDVGRLRSTDNLSANVRLTYRDNQPSDWYQRYSLTLFSFANWTFDGERGWTEIALNTSVTWKNFWQSWTHVHFRPRSYSATLTRGGPLMQEGRDGHISIELSNNPADRFNWEIEVDHTWDEIGSGSFDAAVELAYRPQDRWQFSIEPGYRRSTNPQQYVTTLAGGPDATFGQRYVFGTIKRSTLSAEFRLTYAFTPQLSLELYAEPFAASGRYSRFGELPAPRSLRLRRYGTDGTTLIEHADGTVAISDGANAFTLPNRDFNILSMRSNVVLRWEWRAGSTLYFVWQQDRSDRDTVGRFVQPGDLFDSLTAPGDTFLALKITYWLPVR